MQESNASAALNDKKTNKKTNKKTSDKKTSVKKSDKKTNKKSDTKYKLLIVESPAKAKTIGKYLGKAYHIEASSGHVRDLPKSQMGVDVTSNFEPKYITIRGRGDVLSRIRKEAKGASQILLATDPDREGEAISWHLAFLLGIDPKEPCRVTFQEITKKAVKAAVASPRPIDMTLVDAQQARRVLDRLVGYSISPLLWAKVRKGLSGGRVQSVATRIIVDREDEIDAFVSEEYWDVAATFTINGQSVAARLSKVNGVDAKPVSKAETDDALAAINAGSFSVTSVKTKEKKKSPQPPFTTSNLQQEAARKLHFTAAKTMQIAQVLYEGIDIKGEGSQGLVSYIRTDSVRVSDDALEAVRAEIASRFGADYLPEKPNQYKGRQRAQDAHEAIRPTDISRKPDDIKDSLTKDQFNLYSLIYNRFVSSQMTPATFETITAEIDNGKATMRFYAERKIFPGYTAIYEEGVDDAESDSAAKDGKAKAGRLPGISEGAAAELVAANGAQHFTQPPPRYTEATLIRALEEKGIGRPSTYAPTISTIVARGYVLRERTRLIPTELGRMITDIMREYFKDIVDIQFTSEMESQLDRVEEDNLPWRDVISVFYENFSGYLKIAEESIEKVEFKVEVSDVPCEKCGAMMIYKDGRFGRFLACPNFPECRNTKRVLEYIDTPCPKCGAKLTQRLSKKGRRFYSCEAYPECDYISWDYPVTDKCAECGSPMVLKQTRKSGNWHVCTNPECKARVKLPDDTDNEDNNEDIIEDIINNNIEDNVEDNIEYNSENSAEEASVE